MFLSKVKRNIYKTNYISPGSTSVKVGITVMVIDKDFTSDPPCKMLKIIAGGVVSWVTQQSNDHVIQ
jgi:hypothetical protein